MEDLNVDAMIEGINKEVADLLSEDMNIIKIEDHSEVLEETKTGEENEK